MADNDKPLVWIGTSLKDLRNFPERARRKAGFELRVIQRGELPSDFKAVNQIGPGALEIRIPTDGAFRVFFVAKFDEAVYVLHVFQKKTQRTSNKDVKLGQQRYKEMLRYREQNP
jgi:phage-related protein